MTRHKPNTVTIVITGGHLTPALATIEEISARHPDWEIIFAGRKTSLEGESILSEEYRIITDMGLCFNPLTAGRVKRDLSAGSFVSLMKIPIGMYQAWVMLLRKRPSVIVSYGGYVAFPVAIAGALLGIPVIIHEQTTRPGLSNRIIARIARKVAVSFPDAMSVFGRSGKAVCTGLPVRKDIFTPPVRSPFTIIKRRPIIVIVGGSTGSVSINEQVFESLHEMLKDHIVVHQTGRVSLQKALDVSRSLNRDERAGYIPVAYLSAAEYSWVLHAADFLIGRSGANTVYEAALMAIPAIWIPLPWSGNNEQMHNARILEAAGTSLVLKQDDMNKDSFQAALDEMEASLGKRKARAVSLSRSIPSDGAARFVNLIETIASGTLDA